MVGHRGLQVVGAKPLPSKLVEVQSDGAVVAIREVDVGGINIVRRFQLVGLVQRSFETCRTRFVVDAFTATTASVIGANVYASDFGEGVEVYLGHGKLLVG